MVEILKVGDCIQVKMEPTAEDAVIINPVLEAVDVMDPSKLKGKFFKLGRYEEVVLEIRVKEVMPLWRSFGSS